MGLTLCLLLFLSLCLGRSLCGCLCVCVCVRVFVSDSGCVVERRRSIESIGGVGIMTSCEVFKFLNGEFRDIREQDVRFIKPGHAAFYKIKSGRIWMIRRSFQGFGDILEPKKI